MVGSIPVYMDCFMGNCHAFAKKNASRNSDDRVYGSLRSARYQLWTFVCTESGITIFRRQLETVLAMGRFGTTV